MRLSFKPCLGRANKILIDGAMYGYVWSKREKSSYDDNMATILPSSCLLRDHSGSLSVSGNGGATGF